MNLQEFVLNNNFLAEVLPFLGKYGNPQAEFDYLCRMQVCYESKKNELRVDSRYLVWIEKKGIIAKPRIRVFKTEGIKYCYYSHGVAGGAKDAVYLIYTNGTEERCVILDKSLSQTDGRVIFDNVRGFVHGFEERTSTYKKYRVKSSIGNVYIIGPDGLFLERQKIFSGKIETRQLLPSLQDICWCEQTLSWDSDIPDTYGLVLHLVDGKNIALDATSEYNAFCMALAIKDNVPHLMYEPCEEYRKIYKQYPGQLMEIAKRSIE